MAGKKELKLLGGWFSPFALRIQIALNIKGLEYENVEETLNPKSDLLVQSNPVHKKIPVLLHGEDKAISESAIIVQYIDEVWTNAPSILPANAYDRAIARFWVAFIDDKWFLPLRNLLAAEDEAKNLLFEQVDEALQKLEEAFNKLSEGKAFFGGDSIGIIDIALGSFLSWINVTEKMNGRKVLDEAKTPGLVKWAASFSEDSAVKGFLPETDKLIEFAIALKQKWLADAAAANSK